MAVKVVSPILLGSVEHVGEEKLTPEGSDVNNTVSPQSPVPFLVTWTVIFTILVPFAVAWEFETEVIWAS